VVALVVVMLALTVARVTRLLVADTFPPIARPRERLIRFYGKGSWQAYLLNCPWCMSFYVALVGTVATLHAIGGLPAPVLVFGAVWWVGGWLPASEVHEVEVDEDGNEVQA
jgi:hypothetical protein